MKQMKINSKQTGHGILSKSQSAATAVLAFSWIIVVTTTYQSGLGTSTVILAMFVWGVVISAMFLGLVVNKTRFDRIVTYCGFWLRGKRGQGHIHSFVLPLKDLRKHVPIVAVHEDGLIEYTGKRYGVLFRYDPPPVSPSESEGFSTNMERVVNSFGTNVEVSFHFSNMIDHANPLADSILRSMNTEGKTLEQKQHLHGMYEEAIKSERVAVSPMYLMSVKLGKFKSIKHAQIAYRSTVPGMRKAMSERGIYTIPLTTTNDIAIELIQFAKMERILV